MKKIMFNDKYELTKAVLEGRKTQTRRIMKGKPLLPDDEIEDAGIVCDEVHIIANKGESLIKMKFPYKVGEVVAVAQSYRDCGGFDENGVPMWEIISSKVGNTNAGWDNKMFVREDLMPYRIRITGVRMERLQDISDEDCLKEGIEELSTCSTADGKAYTFNGVNESYMTPREAFAHLINKVSKKGTWEANPYVFVYDFELIRQGKQ